MRDYDDDYYQPREGNTMYLSRILGMFLLFIATVATCAN